MTIEQNFLTKAQATVYTSLSARSLDYARERQEIPFYKKGKRVLFKRADLDAWMERHRAGADLEKIVSEVSSSAMPASDALRCVYCGQFIAADDDAQKVSKREVAHTSCVFAAAEGDALYFLLLDFCAFIARSEQSDDF